VYRHIARGVKWLAPAALVFTLVATVGVPGSSVAAGDLEERSERARRFEEQLAAWQHQLGEGRAAQVLADIEATAGAGPHDPRLHNTLGLVYAALGEVSKSIEQFEAGVRLDPTLAALHLNLAIALSKTAMTGRALSEFEHALELDPTSVEARLGLGHGLLRLRRYTNAIAALAPAAEQAPDDPRVLRALAEAHEGGSAPEIAARAWHAVDALVPSADSARRLGELQRASFPDSARAHFDACVTRDSTAVDCAEAAAALLLDAGDAAGAIQRLGPRVAHLSEIGLLNILIAYQTLDDHASVEALLLRREPGLAPAWGVVALSRRAAGAATAATNAVEKGLALDPESADLENLRGVLLEENGEHTAALAAWRRALELDPTHSEATANLGAHHDTP
jgi:tetratricopeptide (TPR) repeat protein